ncbi:MAG: Asp-tRNA(Asn)/Glu-tRNA(Gln) amidotransferase subunit GatC [Proteobacteria bacterium]|nr:Asp-tRNA(Asn)/Glu-tRNA(Gln) amidotransferase subunit GatC [Pseudomonadota bacterium]MBU1640571.1 Asp-tRNA(Asn)/Glu-tRNA(Gln) amidotransferase subunit GatC [Pseudomonadota bacterium]
MSISKEEVMKVANLARLELSLEEAESMTGQLSTILGYVAKLDEIDCRDIAPTTHVLAIENAFRADEMKPSLSQQEALANAPLQNGEAFVVPRII